MGRRFIWMVAFAAVLPACTSGSTGTTAISTTGESTATSTSTTATTVTSESPTMGRLAVLDSAGDIVVMDPNGTNRETIAEDGGEDNPGFFMQPVWSPDASTLAWGQRTGTGFGVGIGTPRSGTITTLTTPNLPFFTYWSPDSRFLGVLHNGTTGVEFQIADIEQETTSVLDEDAPFYFSWSPDADRVVTHAGTDRVETIGPDGQRVELEPTTGNYLAPQWTENGVFHVDEDELVLEDDNGERRAVAGVSGFTLFVANQQGSLVALQATGDDGSGITAASEEFPTPVTGAVVVVDVDTGETEVVDNSPALAFFWSPDGEHLLTLTTNENEVVPKVWVSGEDVTDYTPYLPPPNMVQDTFPFFPQYAQSMSLWAPDASAYAFAGAVEGEPGIWVQSVGADSPTRVSDGTWVSWSPEVP